MAAPQRMAIILTALPVEREAVVEHLREVREEPPLHGSIYRRGIFDEQSDPWDVVVAEIGAGNAGAAAEAVRIISHYSPEVALFVGVGGAIKDLTQGDVVASTKVYAYESGKDQPDGFRPRPAVELSNYALEQRARFEAGEHTWRLRIKGARAVGQQTVPSAKVGPIAAGEKVLASNRSQIFEFIRTSYGDALAVEMEGHGFLLGVRMNHPTQGIVVRGISDCLGDKNEANDTNWQPIGARHAAAFAFQVLAKFSPPEADLARRTAASAPHPVQQAVFGDVSVNNITINVHQHKGTGPEDLVRLAQAAVPDANAEIDAASARRAAGEPDIAIHLLEELQRRRWDTLTPRERYRLLANLGQAWEAKGELRNAAQRYLECVRHQPDNEKARTFAAYAHYLLGDEETAFSLIEGVVHEHPTCSLAVAVRIRCAPSEISVESLEQQVSDALREELDVLHSLAWRAFETGDMSAAGRFCRTALTRDPGSLEWRELQATIVVQVEERAHQANQPIDSSRLQVAVETLTEALAKSRGQKDLARLRYTRAEAYDLLGKTEDAETDFRAAIECDRQNPGFAGRFAQFLSRHGRDDAAIEALRKADDAQVDPHNRLFLSSLLGERNRPGDREEAVSLLQVLPSRLTDVDPEFCAEVVATLADLHGVLGRHDEALGLLQELPENLLSLVAAEAIRSAVLRRAGRSEEARAVALSSLEKLERSSPESDRLRVAEALASVGEKRNALELWKPLLKPHHPDRFVCRALEFAWQCDDDQFILSFGKQLRAASVHHPLSMELEVVTLEKYAKYDEAIAITEAYLAAPENDELAKILRVRRSLLGMRLSRSELVDCDPAKLPPVGTVRADVGAAVAHILANGPCPDLGVRYAYELVRRYFDDGPVRKAYVGLMGIGGDFNDLFPAPATAAAGCAVKFKADDTGEEKWVIIEDAEEPKADHDELPVHHAWAQEMLGKPVGGRFHLRRDPIQGRTATILAIYSKYAYRKLEIVESWEERFPGDSFIVRYTTTNHEDGTPDVSLIFRAIDQMEQRKQEMHDLYRNNPLSATMFARWAQAGLLESLSHLASEDSLPIRCCTGTVHELETAQAAFAEANAFVLDPSAIATLFFSGQCEHLRSLAGRCVICESTLDEYRQRRRRFASSSLESVGKFKGKYLFQGDDPRERQRQSERLDAFLAKINSLADVKSGESLAGLDPELRKELIGLFAQPTAEAIALAAATGAVLWTDDVAVAEVAREQGLTAKRVWTQFVLRSIAPPEDYDRLTFFLLQWRYFFTRVEPQMVVTAGNQVQWDPERAPLSLVLEWLGSPELQEDGAIVIGSRMLPLVWGNAPLIHQREGVTRCICGELLKRSNGREIVSGICGAIDGLFGIDVLGANGCKAELRAVLAAAGSNRTLVVSSIP